MKNIIWLWKCFWGKKYRIVYTKELCKDEVLFFGHKIYIQKNNGGENGTMSNKC